MLLRQGSFFMSDFLLSCFGGESGTKHAHAFGADAVPCPGWTPAFDSGVSSAGSSLFPRPGGRQPSYFSREGGLKALMAFLCIMTLPSLFFDLQRPLKRLGSSSRPTHCDQPALKHGGPSGVSFLFTDLVADSFVVQHLSSLSMSSSPRCASRMSFPPYPSRHVEVFHEPHTAS